MNFKQIPIFIICRDRHACLLNLIRFFEERDFNNIYLLDNASTYPKLLKYYSTCKYNIFKFKTNFGHTVFTSSGLDKIYGNDYYLLTDCDVVPISEGDDYFMEHYYNIIRDYKVDKAGPALKIDDIPDHYPHKQNVIDWESQYWKNHIIYDRYKAAIDTTFALCKPGFKGPHSNNAIRVAGNFIARHTTWYLDPKNLPEDELWYKQHLETSTHWSQA